MDSLVSVIIPTYSGGKFIGRAISSILKQTYKNVEIIIVDDNNPGTIEREDTRNSVEAYMKEYNNVKYICHEYNKNGSAARNTGIANSTGEYVAFLDDDDYYLPTRIEKSVAILHESFKYSAVLTNVLLTQDDMVLGLVQPKLENDACKQMMFLVNLLGTGSNLFLKRNALEMLGGFDDTFPRFQDVEFMVRFFHDFKATVLNELLIVKTRNGVDNLPRYKKLREVKLYFYQKFDYLINEFSAEERSVYFMKEYERLLKSCFGVESKENINQAINELKQYRELQLKERIALYLGKVEIHGTNMYLWMKRVASSRIKKCRSNRLKRRYHIQYTEGLFSDCPIR